MTSRLVFRFKGQTIVYQDELGRFVARVFGTQQVLEMTPELEAAIDAEKARLASKAGE